MRLLPVAAAIAVATVVLLAPQPAWACSTAPLPTLDEVLESEQIFTRQVVGFHEQRHIARIPGVPFLINERSASVVVRYWGETPNLSVASHGDEGIFILTSTSCASPARPTGFAATQANSEKSLERLRGAGSNVKWAARTSPSPAELAAIESRFGPAVNVSLGFDDYIVAYGLLLWRPFVVFGTFAAIAYGLVRRARGVRPVHAHLDRRTLATAALVVTGIAAITPSYGIVDWLGLLVALAGSVFLGWIMRIPWTAFSVGYAVYFAMRPDPLFRAVSWEGDRRLQTAVGALIIGAGVLVWARGHWTRFTSSFMVVAGLFFFVLGSADVRQHESTAPAVAVGAIVAGAGAAAVWWFVFRERPATGGPEPPESAQPPLVQAAQ